MASDDIEGPILMTFREWIVDYFTMRGALERAASLDVAARLAASAALREAQEKRRAAERLLVEGANAAAIRLACESARRMLEGLDRLGMTDEELRARLGEIGEPPVLDGDVTRAQIDAASCALGAQYAIERRIETRLADRAGLRRLRVVRAVRVAACAAFVVALGSLASNALFGPRVLASSELSAVYGAERAIDGDVDTDWTPKSGNDAWIELSWRLHQRPRVIELMNGRARSESQTGDVRVDLFDGATLVHTVTGSLSDAPPKAYLMLDGGRVRCDRIRIHVEGVRGHTAALAEVVVQ